MQNVHSLQPLFCLRVRHVPCTVCWKCTLHRCSWGGEADGLTPPAVADVKNHAVKNVRLTQRGTLANPDYRSTFIY